MRFSIRQKRKTIQSTVVAALLAATAVTSLSVFVLPTSSYAETAIDPSKGFADLVDQVMPAVISVQVKFSNTSANPGDKNNGPTIPGMPKDFFEQFPQFKDNFPRGDEQPKEGTTGLGSGFIISADGYAVTNNHVVKDASEVAVNLKDGREFKAKVIGTDPKTDLALIKIDSDKPFQFVNLAKEEARVGDWVMAVGNPFGLGGTVTTGIVSARGRDIGSGPYDDFIQIDASINKGNSGGPAFNLKGEVIGVNTAIFSPSGGSVGIGFAIPAKTTQEVIESLKTNGHVTRGWLGVQIQPITPDIAESLGLKEPKGAIVADVTEGSPAQEAGMKTGDVIIKVGQDEISDAKDLSRKVAHVTPETKVAIEVLRNGKPEVISVKLGSMPNDGKRGSVEPASDNQSSFGLSLSKADDGEGVKIIKVEPGSAAEKEGLKPGDVILEIAGHAVSSPVEVQKAFKSTDKSRILMLVRSGNDQRFLAMPLAKG